LLRHQALNTNWALLLSTLTRVCPPKGDGTASPQPRRCRSTRWNTPEHSSWEPAPPKAPSVHTASIFIVILLLQRARSPFSTTGPLPLTTRLPAQHPAQGMQRHGTAISTKQPATVRPSYSELACVSVSCGRKAIVGTIHKHLTAGATVCPVMGPTSSLAGTSSLKRAWPSWGKQSIGCLKTSRDYKL
jgi:hypothetical protein